MLNTILGVIKYTWVICVSIMQVGIDDERCFMPFSAMIDIIDIC